MVEWLRGAGLRYRNRFYRDVLGLVETGRDSIGRVYFKAWDERDHSSVVLRQADSAGIDHFAFKVQDAATFDRLESDVRGWGARRASGSRKARCSQPAGGSASRSQAAI